VVSPLAAGLPALALLALLPGALVVRAPWTAVPALSLAFWVLCAWWPPLAGRGRFLAAALLVFGLLSLWILGVLGFSMLIGARLL
jgi:hypothetical protein